MFSKLKEAFETLHVVGVLVGFVLAAGIAWGTGTAGIAGNAKSIVQLDGRVTTLEKNQRDDIRDMRNEMNGRFNELTQLIKQGK